MKQKLPNLLRRGKGLLLAFAAATMTISHAQAQDKVKVNNFYYYLNAENKTAELAPTEETTAYATGRLVIPGSINYEGETYSVDVIGDYAFSFCDGITSVSIPSSVKRIGNGAFQGCKKINTVSFMMSTVEEIGDAAFEGCETIGSITLPATLKKLGDWAFAGCTGLRTGTIPASVEHLGKNVYMRCTGMSVAAIRCQLTEMPDGMFDHCTSLKKITMADSIKNNIRKIGVGTFYDCPQLTTFAFGDSVAKIDACGFMGCTGLGKVTLPESVKHIGHDAFSACQKMSEINIPANVDSIGDHAFKDAHALKQITMSDSVKYLGEQAFAYCQNLTSAKISKNITEIRFKTFAGCTKLTDFTLSPNITIIADSAFQGVKCFDTLKLSNLNSVGDYAFADCGKLKYVYMPEKLRKIGNYTFKGDSIEQYYVEWTSAPAIKSGYFTYCDTLFIPEGTSYKFRTGWREAKNIKEFDKRLTGINNPAIARDDDEDGAYYTIEGIKVIEPKKGGIYIHNGKKVIIR